MELVTSSTFSISDKKENETMKECPKCKNLLPESAYLCPNCGMSIESAERRRKKKYQNQSGESEQSTQTNFGNYYDDIIPEDAEELKNRQKDNSMVLKFILLGFGVTVALSLCIALLILFGGGEL